MYSFPHEFNRLTHTLLVETPLQESAQRSGADGYVQPFSLPWRFEVNLSDSTHTVYTDPVQIYDDVADVPVINMVNEGSVEEIDARVRVARDHVYKVLVEKAWQSRMAGLLTEKGYDGERMMLPPADVIEVQTDGEGITLFNFCANRWGEEDRQKIEGAIDEVVNGQEAKRLFGCPTIWVMEAEGVCLARVNESGDQRPVVISEELFRGPTGFLASIIATYVSVRSERSERIAPVCTRKAFYEKPWGLPKPELITLL